MMVSSNQKKPAWRWGVAIVATGALLGGCGSAKPDPSAKPGVAASPTTSPRTSATSSVEQGSSPTAASSTAVPSPANGTDISACENGPCEVGAAKGALIGMPVHSGVMAVEVSDLSGDSVTVTGGVPAGGTLTTSCTDGTAECGVSGNSFFAIMKPGSKAIENNVSIVFEGIRGGDAVLKFDVVPTS